MMAPANSLAASLQPYRFQIIALACLAAGATIYYAQTLQTSVEAARRPRRALHRSNARQRARRRRSAGVPPEPEQRHLSEQASPADGGANAPAIVGGETENDAISEFSWEGHDERKGEDESNEGQSLLFLLYKIAEEQSRTDGYVHRGVACDSCNENPIKGIRYRCVNCADHDLCETCESAQNHNRQHLFLKIRIPAPQLGTHKERQPVFYPGKPKANVQDLRKEKVDRFCKETGYKSEEVEAVWEQFRSMAATEWPSDPDHYGLAIDRPTFDRCFVPSSSGCLPPPNLIYNRIFSYYDTNNDGLVGFAEYIGGLSSLKKKNMGERMKRVFKAYDINNDGYVDRRDFLRIFTAYFTHIKELMGDIVASMQDDDDQDTLELVSGGQPISSAFHGPGPFHTVPDRDGETGKLQNDLGDYEVVDSMGAVDDREFDPVTGIGDIISENTILSRWPNKCHPLSWTEFPKSGQAIHNFITSSSRDELEGLIKYYDVQHLLPEAPSQKSLETPARRALHGKLAEELRHCRAERRQAIRRRAQKQIFYPSGGSPTSPLHTSPDVDGILIDERQHTQMEKDFEDIKSSGLFEEFNGRVIMMVEALDWPLDEVPRFKDSIYDMVCKGCGSSELVQDIDGYSANPKEAREFVSSFVKLLSRMASQARQQSHYNANPEDLSGPTRSRSSSEVSIGNHGRADEDGGEGLSCTGLNYPESGPFDERRDALEAPEPGPDVAREVLFAVTEEALNELLDPVFQLREDLALRALMEREHRSKYRANIIAAVRSHQSLRDVKLYVERYSRTWRQRRDNPPSPSPPPPHDPCDEADSFWLFVELMVGDGVEGADGTTSTEPSKHGQTSWVRLGEYCRQTQFHSKTPTDQPEGRRREDGETSPAEACLMCAQMNKESWISGLYCGQCGQPCSRLIAEETEVRRIIETGGQVSPLDLEADSSSHTSSLERNPSPVQFSSEIADNAGAAGSWPARAEDISTTYTAHEEPSASDHLAEIAKPRDDARLQSTSQALKPNDPGPVYKGTASYPETTNDLRSSRATSNAFDGVHPEATTLRKSISESVAKSGNLSARADQTSIRDPVPDPTLPQNRPNTVPLSQASLASPHAAPNPPSSPSSPLRNRGDEEKKEQKEERNMKTKERNEHHNEENPNSNSTSETLHDILAEPGHDPDAPSEAKCKFYACLDLIEAEDRKRGGPGRISFEEFEEIMMGEKGAALGFLASWVEIGAF